MFARATIRTFAATMFSAATVLSPVVASAKDVGTMTAEKSAIMRSGVRVRSGSAIALGDRLAANSSGSGVIVFEDESSARMGPNSVLTIDNFVYDPSRSSGKIQLRQMQGLTRIYGGQISKRGRSEVRTPHIVLVVRGGIADLGVLGDKSIATLRGGIMTCIVKNVKKKVTNPGISCISDGKTLEITRLSGTGHQLVTPAGTGGGTGGGTTYDSAHCSSAFASDACGSNNGGLPRPGTHSKGDDPQTGAPSGGGKNTSGICVYLAAAYVCY